MSKGLQRLLVILVGASFVATGFLLPARADANAPVVLIVMENHSFGATDIGVNGNTGKYIVGNTTDAPYVNGTLIPSGTLFTNYLAYKQSSMPNYLMMTAGTDLGCPKNPCAANSDPNENLFHLMGAAGIPFISLQESMPTNCALGGTNTYRVGHNPEAYYTNINAKAAVPYGCPYTDVPITAAAKGTADAWPNPLPAFSLVTPNLCNDMHGSDPGGPCDLSDDQLIKDGDTWLAANVPAFLAAGALVIVTFDEAADHDTAGGGGHIPTIMVGPGVPAGATDATPLTHPGLLAGLEEYFDLSPLLAAASGATPVVIPRTTPYASPSITGLSPEQGLMGSAVTISGSGLTNTYAVAFGGVGATFVVDSDGSITATVPSGAVDGPVTVTSVGGTATSPDGFTVTGKPPPPTLVQHAVASGTGKTAGVALTNPSTSGDLLVASMGWYGSVVPTTPPGWSRAISTGNIVVYYRENAPTTTGPVSIPFSGSATWVVSLSEWTGVAAAGALDRTASAGSASNTGTTALSGTTAVTSQPVELAIAGFRGAGTATQSPATNGFALLDFGNPAKDTFGTNFLVTTTAGARSTSVTLSAPLRWRGVIVTFRGA